MNICYGCRCSTPNSPPNPCINYDYVITQVAVDSGCWAQHGGGNIMDTAWEMLFETNPCNFPYDTCPSSTNQYSEDAMSCTHTWTYVWFNTATSQWDTSSVVTYCPTYGWCVNKYNICYNPVTHTNDFTLIWSLPFTGNCSKQPPGYSCTVNCPAVITSLPH